jgi:hypothetical protein
MLKNETCSCCSPADRPTYTDKAPPYPAYASLDANEFNKNETTLSRKNTLPLPTTMPLEFDTSTSHRKNELLTMRSVEALEFPRKSSDTQPPPATALRDRPIWGESVGTTATALLSDMLQPTTLTFHISKAATAPPHVEHGSLDRVPVGHPIKPPTAEFRLNVLFSTRRNKLLPSPVADMAPPLAALQLMKQQRDTVTLLPTADTAPPLPSLLAVLERDTHDHHG